MPLKCQIPYSSKEIVECRTKRGPELTKMVDIVLKALYKCNSFERVLKSYVKRNGGNEEDAKDLRQDGLSELAVKLIQGGYSGTGTIENFALGICKYKWLNILALRGLDTTALEPIHENMEGKGNVEEKIIKDERNKNLSKIVDNMRGNCSKFLKLWAKGYSHREIGNELGVNEARARRKTSECRKKLRDLINGSDELNDLF